VTRVLVTGGAGYIGSHTAKALSAAGYEPVVLDNFSTGHRWAVRWGPLVEGDLADDAVLRAALRDYHVQAVIHFAASAYVAESVRDPTRYFRNNVMNSLGLVEAMLDSDVRTIVFSSSCTTYGVPEALPIREAHPQQPVNPYGESKRFVERALHWCGQAHGLRWATLRYFNAAGADPDGEIGECHEPETHLIPLVIEAALGHRPFFDVYGVDYPTPDGTAVRDFVHVTDLAAAHVKALRHLFAGGENVTLNLGTGQGHSVREVVAAVEHVAGRSVPVREAARRPGDPAALVADPRLAAEVLGWRPRYPGLDDVVGSAWHWHSLQAGRQLVQGELTYSPWDDVDRAARCRSPKFAGDRELGRSLRSPLACQP
jgi:UDP-glucose-4-epimerase GalE